MKWLFQVFLAYPRNLYHYMTVSGHDGEDQLRYELGIVLGILFFLVIIPALTYTYLGLWAVGIVAVCDVLLVMKILRDMNRARTT